MQFDLKKFVSESEEKLPETFPDDSGAVLTPGRPQTCEGNGKDERFEICCDECNWFLACFPEYCDSNYSPPEELTPKIKYTEFDGEMPY